MRRAGVVAPYGTGGYFTFINHMGFCKWWVVFGTLRTAFPTGHVLTILHCACGKCLAGGKPPGHIGAHEPYGISAKSWCGAAARRGRRALRDWWIFYIHQPYGIVLVAGAMPGASPRGTWVRMNHVTLYKWRAPCLVFYWAGADLALMRSEWRKA